MPDPDDLKSNVSAREVGALIVLDHFSDMRLLKEIVGQFLGAREVRTTPKKKGRRRRA